jgi:hypothetical protein
MVGLFYVACDTLIILRRGLLTSHNAATAAAAHSQISTYFTRAALLLVQRRVEKYFIHVDSTFVSEARVTTPIFILLVRPRGWDARERARAHTHSLAVFSSRKQEFNL